MVTSIVDNVSSPPEEYGRSTGSVNLISGLRHELSLLFKVKEQEKIIILPSATIAINLVISGIINGSGKHVITTTLEHNSVLRPLAHLERKNRISIDYIHPQKDGIIDINDIDSAIKTNTGLIAVTHASNVTGCIQPVEKIAQIAADNAVPLLIDASQSAGGIPLDYDNLPGRVFVAFAGHKGLFGPGGIGGLIVADNELDPLFPGGTGIKSEARYQPEALPVKYEAGTMNMCGVAGLTEGVKFVNEKTVSAIGEHKSRLVNRLRNNLSEMGKIKLSPLSNEDGRSGIVSFVVNGVHTEEVGYLLEHSFDIRIRTGLHCAPLIHQDLGSYPEGNLRISFSIFNTEDELDTFVKALKVIV